MPSDATEPETARQGDAGDTVDSHILLSGVGGPRLRTEKDEGAPSPLEELEADDAPGVNAPNEGTGQSEKPTP